MRVLVVRTIALTLLAAGCSNDGGDGTPPAPVASITVSPAALTLRPGESMQLDATLHDASNNVLRGRTVTWTSANTQKAAVTSAGVVRALAVGDVKITAAAEGKSTTVQVNVVERPLGAVSRVELSTSFERIEEGASLQLEATAYDDANNIVTGRAVRWASDDAEVAAVEPGGLVTGLKPGVATVSARVDGREAAATIRVFADYPFELLYSRQDAEVPAELFALDISDPAAVALPVFGPGKHASHGSPSPDGARIAFVVHGQWDGTFWQSMIFVADRDGANSERLIYLPARNVEPAWSPDGTWIAFSSQPSESVADIWLVEVEGGHLINLTADQPAGSKRSPAWSAEPIGGVYRIAYSLETGGASSLWSMRADGGDKRAITSDPRFFDSEPAWSPDGATLVFQRTGEGIFGDLHLVPSAGGAVRALMPANPLPFGQFGPVWSPDGRLVAFTSKHADGQRYQVWTVWADGTRLARRTQELESHADPAWIPKP